MEPVELDSEEQILSFLAEGGDDFTSGTALSDKLGMSRTAVWKHMETLRRLGYQIEAIASRGYRLTGVPDRLTPLEVGPLLGTRELGRVLHFAESLPSTNARAFELASAGAAHGEVVIAEEQTAGRGRRGRAWASPAGKNLYLSVVLRPELAPQRAPELTLVAAVALAQTIADSGLEAKIKWPNDVQLGGKKVAGILTELSSEPERVHFVVLGMGVNLNAAPADFPPEVAELATSLAAVRGVPVPRALFAAALLTRLEQWLEVHAQEGFSPVRAAWKGRSSTLGHEVLVRTERTELRGLAEDVDESGALLVRDAQGTVHQVLAGDVEQLRARQS